MAEYDAGPTQWPTEYGLRPVPNDPAPEATTQDAQVAAEGIVVPDGELLEFMGEKFRIADAIGLAPMMVFASVSKRGATSDDMAGLAAMHDLIRDVIWRPPAYDANGVRQVDELTGEPAYVETEWDRFLRHAIDEKAEGEDLMEFVGKVMELVSARPSKRREISSGGSPRTSEKSKDASSSPATHPDMAGLVAVRDVGR